MVATVVGTSSACVLSRRRRMAAVIVATPGWELPTTSERQSYLLIVLPKLKTSISSSMKRTSASSMAWLRRLRLRRSSAVGAKPARPSHER